MSRLSVHTHRLNFAASSSIMRVDYIHSNIFVSKAPFIDRVGAYQKDPADNLDFAFRGDEPSDLITPAEVRHLCSEETKVKRLLNTPLRKEEAYRFLPLFSIEKTAFNRLKNKPLKICSTYEFSDI